MRFGLWIARRRKAIATVIGFVAEGIATVVAPTSTAGHIVQAVLAVLTISGMYAVRNVPMPPPVRVSGLSRGARGRAS